MANKLAVVPSGRGIRVTRDAELALLEFQSPTAELLARPIPLRSRVTIWAIVSMLAVMLLVAGTMPIDRTVEANGRVISREGTIVVQPLDTSIVRAMLVHEGQVVHAGDVLAKLDPTFALADVGTYQAQVVSLQAEVDRLGAELSGRPYLSDGTPASALQASIYTQRRATHEFKMSNYKEKIDSLKSAVARAVGDMNGFAARLDGARQVESMRSELDRLGAGSKLNTLSARDNRLEIERGLAGAKNTVAASTSDFQAMLRERDGAEEQYRTETSQTLTEQGRKLSDARELLNKAVLHHQLVELKAEQDAVVQKVADVSVGAVLQSGDTLFTMVPSDAPLEVEAYIAGRDAGFVHPGDSVSIKFDTFDFVTYGSAKGTVRTVSADSFQNPTEDRSKLARPSQQQTETPLGPVYFKARITIDEMKLHDLPDSFRMSPGMPINADIQVGKRTVLGYLLGRAVPSMTQGMREP